MTAKRRKANAIVLGVLDRITLLNLLIEVRGNMMTQRLVRELEQRLGFSRAELKRIQFSQDADGVRWRADRAAPKRYTFHPLERTLVAKQLRALDKAEQLTRAHARLWDLFVGAEEA